MELDVIRALFKKYLKADSALGFGEANEFEKPLEQAITIYTSEHPYPEPEFYDIASNFFHSQGEYGRVEEILERWKKAKGKPLTPIIRHALLYFADNYIGYEACLNHILEGLQQEPENPLLLSIAYQAAVDEKDTGRRLHYAARLAAISADADQHIAYGVECAKNLMLDRAEAAFEKARGLNPKDVRALNGLGRCRLEKLKLGEAEELFEQSQRVMDTPLAKRSLEIIQRLRNGKAWSNEQKRLQKFWDDWTDKELGADSAEEQKRLVTECFSVTGQGK